MLSLEFQHKWFPIYIGIKSTFTAVNDTFRSFLEKEVNSKRHATGAGEKRHVRQLTFFALGNIANISEHI